MQNVWTDPHLQLYSLWCQTVAGRGGSPHWPSPSCWQEVSWSDQRGQRSGEDQRTETEDGWGVTFSESNSRRQKCSAPSRKLSEESSSAPPSPSLLLSDCRDKKTNRLKPDHICGYIKDQSMLSKSVSPLEDGKPFLLLFSWATRKYEERQQLKHKCYKLLKIMKSSK